MEGHRLMQASQGRPRLKRALASAYSKTLGRELNANSEVTVTTGANEGMLSIFMAFLEPGDEVIIIEPFFDQYVNAIEMARGVVRYVPLQPPVKGASQMVQASDWTIDWETFEATFNARTKAVLLNSPHNPLGKVLSGDEASTIGALAQKHGVLIACDDVYERMCYVPSIHIGSLSPELSRRTLIVGSAGKTFYATGWRVGWVVGPADLIQHVSTAHTRICYSSPSPLQEATAEAFERADKFDFWNQSRLQMLSRVQRFTRVLDELGLPVRPLNSQTKYRMESRSADAVAVHCATWSILYRRQLLQGSNSAQCRDTGGFVEHAPGLLHDMVSS